MHQIDGSISFGQHFTVWWLGQSWCGTVVIKRHSTKSKLIFRTVSIPVLRASDFCDSKHLWEWSLLETWLNKKWSFPLRISLVNITRSAGYCVFGQIYWKNSQSKTSFSVQWWLNKSFYVKHFTKTNKKNIKKEDCSINKSRAIFINTAKHLWWIITLIF